MTNNNTNSTTEEFSIAFQKYFFILCVVQMVVGFVIFVINLPTIVTFVMNRHHLRRSVYCLINLAVADILLGLFIMIWFIMVLVQYFGLIFIFLNFATWSLLFISLLSLVVVSLDRVYATFFPFRHRTTRFRMYIAVFTISWLLPILIRIILQLESFDTYFSTFLITSNLSYLICLVIICTSYTAIFARVKIQAKRLQPNQQQTAAVQRRQKREQNLAMTLFIVTVLSLITWLPIIICFNLFFLPPQNSHIFPYFLMFSFLLQETNSLINPIVYVFRMRDFRKALKKLIFKCSRDQQHTHPIGHHGNHDRQQQPPIELQEM